MENLSHSLSKKICNGNVVNNGFPPTKSVYDDVFGGPPKFGVPTFSPRVEDYSEIFGGFHASRGSSIPVLDLPLVDDETEIFFDVRSSNFDYSEVFGGFDGLDFSVSCEEFFDEAHGEVESFEEAWTLAETESMSEESDPYAHSGKSHSFSNEDSHQSCDGIEELHVSYLNANLKSKDDMPNRACITQLHAVPGFALVVDDEITPLQRIENRNPSLQLTDDINLDTGLIERNIGGKHLRKTMSYTPSSIAGMHTLGKDAKCQRSYSQNGCHPNGMFLNVSEISLRTDPSQLPPPSRPPPLKSADSNGVASDPKVANNYALEGTTGDSSPPYFDVEVDASSSAAASAAAMKEAMEQAQAKLKSAKELMERKKEGLQSRAKLGSKSDIKDNKGKTTKVVDGMNNLVGEERQKVIKTTLGVPYSVEGDEFFDVVEKTTGKMLGTEHCPGKEFCQTEAAGEWIEANEFFELVKTDKFSKVLEQTNSGKIQVENTKAQERLCKEKKTAMKASERQEDNLKKNNAVRESCEQVENEKKLKAAKEALNQEHDKRVDEDPKFYKQKEDQKQFKLAYEQGEIEKNLASVDMWKEYDISIKNQREMDEVDIMEGVKQKENDQKRKDSNERIENDNSLKEARERRENDKRFKERNDNSLKEARERRENDKRFKETFEQEEYKRLCEAFELAEIAERLKQGIEKEEKEKWLKEDYDQEQVEKKQKEALEREENERRLKEALEREENQKRLKEASERKKNEKKQKEAQEREENERRLKEALEREESEKRLKEASERKKNEKKQKEAHDREENKKKLKEALEREENEKRIKEAIEKEANERKQKEALEREENEKRIKEAIEKEANERKQKVALEREENEKRIKEVIEKEANERKQKLALEREENEKRIKEVIEKEANERKQKEVREREEYEKRLREAWEREEDENRLRQACEREENEKRLKQTQRREENEKRTKEVVEQDKIEQRLRQAFKWEESKKSVNDAVEGVELEGARKAYDDTMQDENAKLLKQAQGTRVQIEVNNHKASDEVCKLDGKKNLRAAEVAFEHEKRSVGMEATQEISSEEKNENISTELKHGESIVVEAVEKTFARVANRSEASGMVQGDLQPEEIGIRGRDATSSLGIRGRDATSSLLLDETVKESGEAVTGTEQTGVEDNIKVFQMPSDPKHTEERHTREWGERGKNIGQAQVAVDHKLNKDKYRPTQMVNEGVGNGRTGGGAPLSVLGKKGRTQKPAQHVTTGQSTGRKEKIVYETFKLEERERELEQDRLRKVEEEREREREREKDRMAVERATHEVRERAYAEVRDRAERAAVERATTDARQRAMTEARERLEKACAEAREKSLTEKASVEARIRAERAAVERATAEARERAVEKAMSEKASFEARERAERSASSSGSRYPYSSIYAAISNEGESAQRCKARLERHQRTAERAAKALAEKNIRDLLAQREQAERNRLAESLDADVKRWSSGKEGNLRALLSTLQYILGTDSGWYPIPLTEVITAAAVKKAYRKATLFVHPDKLQQRRASIQQKYICEKVFDLLKEAWNKFNSEER